MAVLSYHVAHEATHLMGDLFPTNTGADLYAIAGNTGSDAPESSVGAFIENSGSNDSEEPIPLGHRPPFFHSHLAVIDLHMHILHPLYHGFWPETLVTYFSDRLSVNSRYISYYPSETTSAFLRSVYCSQAPAITDLNATSCSSLYLFQKSHLAASIICSSTHASSL